MAWLVHKSLGWVLKYLENASSGAAEATGGVCGDATWQRDDLEFPCYYADVLFPPVFVKLLMRKGIVDVA